MSDTTLLALFEDIDPAADAIDKLHEMGVTDERLNVISGIPIAHKMLGRPHQWTNVSRLALGGAGIGFCIGLFLNFGTPYLYYVPSAGSILRLFHPV